MEHDVQKEAINTWVNKNELEKALSIGIHRAPEFKHEEKKHYLGEFRERVIRLLTKKQVMEPAIYPEIAEALKDRRAVKMIINGDIDYRFVKKYVKLAQKMGKTSTVIHDPGFKGETGLIVAGDGAVDVQNIDVPDRETRLKKLGVSPALIHSAGKKVCERCYKKIIHADPGEAINYQLLTLADRFWGERCSAC